MDVRRGPGQEHAHLLAALQFAHLALVEFVGNVETLEKDGRVGLSAVYPSSSPTMPSSSPRLHAVFIGHVRLGVDVFALFQRGPEALVAHDDGVNDAVRIESELVLAKDAELARTDDGSLLRARVRRSGAS